MKSTLLLVCLTFVCLLFTSQEALAISGPSSANQSTAYLATQGVAGEQSQSLSKRATKKAKRVARKIQKRYKSFERSRGDRSFVAALLISIFLGGLGIDRMYLGYVGLGILKLLTLGGFGIWYLIDIILIAVDSLRPKNGEYYDR